MTDTAPVETTQVVPDSAGTFALYLLPDGAAGLVLDVEGKGVSRHRMPKLIVDLLIHGKRPSPKDVFAMMRGGSNGTDEEAEGAERDPETGDE